MCEISTIGMRACHSHVYSTVILGCFHCTKSPITLSQRTSLKLLGREIIFEEFQPMWARYRYLNITDRQTDAILWQYCALRSIAQEKEIITSWIRIHDM